MKSKPQPKRAPKQKSKQKPKRAPKPAPIAGQCFNCKTDVTEDHLCYGCKEFICETCNVGSLGVPWGGHERDAHLKHYDDNGNEIDAPEDDA